MNQSTPIHTDTLYQNANLVQFYDYDNPWSEGFTTLLHQVKKTDIVLDLGCGTGTLTAELAKKCQKVYGIDLAAEMLEIAQTKSSTVSWMKENICTFSLDQQFDVILLSGHSFQTLQSDADRLALFQKMKQHLKPTGFFIFDSRNPIVEEWKTWTPQASIRYFKHPTYGVIKAWNDWEKQNHLLCYHTYYQTIDATQLWQASSLIDFPSQDSVVALLEEAGLTVENLFGDWELNPFTPTSEEMIFKGTHL